MVDFIEGAVEDIRDNPNSGDYVELIIGVEESYEDVVIDRLEQMGASRVEEGPFNTLLARIEEDNVAAVCELSHLIDIELNSKGQVLQAGN